MKFINAVSFPRESGTLSNVIHPYCSTSRCLKFKRKEKNRNRKNDKKEEEEEER